MQTMRAIGEIIYFVFILNWPFCLALAVMLQMPAPFDELEYRQYLVGWCIVGLLSAFPVFTIAVALLALWSFFVEKH